MTLVVIKYREVFMKIKKKSNMILIKSPWKLNIYRGKKNMLNDIWPDLQNVRKMTEKKDLGFSPK